MKTSVIGYPRIGKLRELKFAEESYFKKEISQEALYKVAQNIKEEQWKLQQEAGIDLISSHDFSFYDGMLDTAVMLGAIPRRYQALKLNALDTYFAMARGYQGEQGDVKALAMKKWFNTNYHYMVPEIEEDTRLSLTSTDFLADYRRAQTLSINTKPVVIGGFTFIQLAKLPQHKSREDYINELIEAYQDILKACNREGVAYLQIDEPILVTDLNKEEIEYFTKIYQEILKEKGKVKVILQTYFGDIRDCYKQVMALNFDGIGLDFVEGKKTLKLIKENGFDSNKFLIAGIVNGKNIWKCQYEKALNLLQELQHYVTDIVISSSCSLLHVPYTLENEIQLSSEVTRYFAFAKEKLTELNVLGTLIDEETYKQNRLYIENVTLFKQKASEEKIEVKNAIAALSEADFIRLPERTKRQKLQRKQFSLPLLPTTTIGSFPQTKAVKRNRTQYKKGEISKEVYEENIRGFIKECVALQEDLGLDVLVHGEYERNDMVEYFGEHLSGYVFTEKAWVQSYGTRCVKPPIIFEDIKREAPITVDTSVYAKSLTNKEMKGMLTGPVTILNWSFPREDISLKEMAMQIGLAIREEVLDLERNGIRIIQIDEAALKEKLPIRKAEWYSDYLDWAIPAFRLTHSKVKPETQIHTHMCYSEFGEIVKDIDAMNADVITIEASRSSLEILDALNENNFETEVGPGVYDIHSPRIPSVEEIEDVIRRILHKLPKEKVWINPDCGLKTRGEKETKASLENLVTATKNIRVNLIK